jgi:Raf kinase inhibitor-like YbhB/YbcL family protein
MHLTLTSTAFTDGSAIPKEFTGEGSDRSPQLEWSHVPPGTRSFALICDDPDAPTPEPFVHWVLFNIGDNVTTLPEGLPHGPRLMAPVLAEQGTTSFGKVGYNGPFPPVGHGWHHYHFTLYALDTRLSLRSGATKDELVKAMHHHTLGHAKLTGRYQRVARRAA